MTVRVLEHDGLFTAYRLVIRRKDDGSIFESVKQIEIPFPPPGGAWREWAANLDQEQLEVGLQIYYDKWNFGRGSNGEHVIYTMLTEEQERRRLLDARTDEVLKAANTNPPAAPKHKRRGIRP